ncbi:MAG: Ig-like domain-containing protein [Sporichthyaceae bacterium]
MLRRTTAVCAAAMLLAGCAGAQAAAPPADLPAAPIAEPAAVRISPSDGAANVALDGRVTVAADRGTLRTVDLVDSSGKYLAGEFNAERTSWTSSSSLVPGRSYSVAAAALGADGLLASAASAFQTKTLPTSQHLRASMAAPAAGSTVGVAYPLVVTFNRPVANRRTVTAALDVQTSPHVEGAWYWIDARTVDYRPKSFWPAGTKVTLNSNLDGVYAGNGLWGVADTTSGFEVGRRQVIEVDVKKREMTVTRDGKKLKTFPVSTGKAGWETRNGTKVIMDKVTDKTWTNEEIDAPEEYTLESDYAMRLTNSGEFIHDATWNTGIGDANTSHGCVGMNLDDMKWLYNNTMIGDAVVTTGSPRPFTTIWNRYQDWNVTWAHWLTGNYDLTDG